MLIEMYIFFELIVIALFLLAFFTKQEIMWAIVSVLSSVLMFSSFAVETYVYEYNQTIGAYTPILITHHYLYLVWINGLFFVLALLLGLFDLFDKYGTKFMKNTKQDGER